MRRHRSYGLNVQEAFPPSCDLPKANRRTDLPSLSNVQLTRRAWKSKQHQVQTERTKTPARLGPVEHEQLERSSGEWVHFAAVELSKIWIPVGKHLQLLISAAFAQNGEGSVETFRMVNNENGHAILEARTLVARLYLYMTRVPPDV